MKDIYFGITLLTDQKKYTSEKKLIMKNSSKI